MDGPHFRHDLPEITGARHFRAAPIQNLIAANAEPYMAIFYARRRRSANGVRNRVFIAAIRVRKASRSESRRIGLVSGWIFQKSSASIRHFWEAPFTP